MKIGMVCYPTVGGSGVVATLLGCELAKRGHEVHFITYERPFRLPEDNERIYFHPVDILSYALLKYPDYALTLAVKMAQVAKEYGLDLFHVHYAVPHAVSAYLTKGLLGSKRLPIVTTLHGTDITLVGRDPAYFELARFSIEQSDALTAVSHSLAAQTKKCFHIDTEIDVIYNFFTPKGAFLSSKVRRGEFVSGDEKLIIHVSNFRPVKRIEDVLATFYKIQKKVPCRLLLLGAGIGVEEARRLSDELQIADRVIFLGEKLQADPYISSADLMLLPSSQESFGLVALEAMAYGVPVVASRVGGIPEVVREGETGFLAPLGDTDAMSDLAIRLLKDETLYRQFSERAQEIASSRFSAQKIVPRYEALYEAITPHNQCSV